MRFHAFHGVMTNENIIGGEYTVTLKIGYDFSTAAHTDDINAAIDYGNLYSLIQEEMKTNSRLIEHLAQRIQDAILSAYPQIISMETHVSKLNPPIEGEMEKASIQLNFTRNS